MSLVQIQPPALYGRGSSAGRALVKKNCYRSFPRLFINLQVAKIGVTSYAKNTPIACSPATNLVRGEEYSYFTLNETILYLPVPALILRKLKMAEYHPAQIPIADWDKLKQIAVTRTQQFGEPVDAPKLLRAAVSAFIKKNKQALKHN